MNQEYETEQLVRLSRAARLVEQITGDGVSPATLYRWASRGLSGVRLRVLCTGGHMRTNEQWLRNFFEELSEVRQSNSTPKKSRDDRRVRAKQSLASEDM